MYTINLKWGICFVAISYSANTPSIMSLCTDCIWLFSFRLTSVTSGKSKSINKSIRSFKHLCVLIYTRTKVVNMFKPSSVSQGGASFVFMFYVCLCHAVLSVLCSLVITCWERADLLAC